MNDISNNNYMLTENQQLALKLAKSGENLLITGSGGSGKSFLIHEICDALTAEGKNVVLAAPTGVAACNIGGTTLHRLFNLGIGPCISPRGKLLKRTTKLINTIDTLIIDEISMVRADLFDCVANSILGAKHKIQLIIVGDFMQLPPVVTDYDRAILQQFYHETATDCCYYAFQGNLWKKFEFIPVYLTEIKRQKDAAFIRALNGLNTSSNDSIRFFAENTSRLPFANAINLFARNADADAINLKKLSELPGTLYSFIPIASMKPEYDTVGDIQMPEEFLNIKVGARVIMCSNAPGSLDKDPLYVNGSMGTVIDINTNGIFDSITVRFDHSGKELDIYRQDKPVYTYTLNADGKPEREEIGTVSQFPLRLGWAITIHKSQGLTLEYVNLDPYCFAAGMLYVALSRCTDIKHMHLLRPIKREYVIQNHQINSFVGMLFEACEANKLLLTANNTEEVSLLILNRV